MKVYLVEMDNGEMYEDYHCWTEKAFSSYRKASDWLLKEGFMPDFTYNLQGNIELYFYSEINDGEAWINEMNVDDTETLDKNYFKG